MRDYWLFCICARGLCLQCLKCIWNATTIFPMKVILCSDTLLVCVLRSQGGSSGVFVSQGGTGENAPQVLRPRGKGHDPLYPGGGAGVGPQH